MQRTINYNRMTKVRLAQALEAAQTVHRQLQQLHEGLFNEAALTDESETSEADDDEPSIERQVSWTKSSGTWAASSSASASAGWQDSDHKWQQSDRYW